MNIGIKFRGDEYDGSRWERRESSEKLAGCVRVSGIDSIAISHCLL